MSTHIEQPSYGELLDTVRGLQRYARAARQYLPLHLGTNLVELARDAEDLVLRAECVQEDQDAPPALKPITGRCDTERVEGWLKELRSDRPAVHPLIDAILDSVRPKKEEKA